MSELSLGVKIWGDVSQLVTSLNKGKAGVDEFSKKSGGQFAELGRALAKAGLVYKNTAAQLGPNSPESKAALSNFQKLRDAAGSITDNMKPKQGMLGGLKGELMGVAAGFMGLTALAGGVASFFKGAVQGAMDDERAEKKLAFSVQNTAGEYERLIAYKEQMMKSTLFTEDEIMSAMTMGTELGRTEAQTKKMVETAMGLANVTGVDLNTAMLQLSGTFDGNMGRLAKYLPAITELTEAQLKNGEAVEMLNVKFGKYATEGLDTAGGQVKQFQKAWEDFSDSVGKKILPAITGLLKGLNALGGNAVMSSSDRKKLQDANNKYLEDNKANKGAKGQKGTDYNRALGLQAQLKSEDLRLSIAALKVSNEQAILDSKRNKYLEDLNAGKTTEIQLLGDESDALKGANDEWNRYVEYMRSVSSGNMNGPTSADNKNDSRGNFNVGPMSSKTGGVQVDTGYKPSVGGGVSNDAPVDQIKTITEAINAATSALAGLGSNAQAVFASVGEFAIQAAEGFKEGWQSAAAAVGGVLQSVVSFVSGLFSQQTEQRISELDSQTEAQRASIESSTMSEQQKKKAIDKMEADSNKKRKALMREQAKDQKTTAIMQAIVVGALAVIQALSAGPILGIVLAALVGAMVVAQVATIASQPLPALAGGGLASAPTLALVGDNPNARVDPEVISPLSKLKDMIFGGSEQGSTIGVTVRGDDLYFMLERVKKRQSRI
jgi:hypothetical protein